MPNNKVRVIVLTLILAVLLTSAVQLGKPRLFVSTTGQILSQIREVCADHATNCPEGEQIAALSGYLFSFRTVEGITTFNFGLSDDSGFSVFDNNSGMFAQNVVFPGGYDGEWWWFDGYKPSKEGEHVKVDIYGLYAIENLAVCSPEKDCGEDAYLVVSSKLADLGLVCSEIIWTYGVGHSCTLSED